MARLDGKVAIITGAAHGMGAVTARLFVAEGARVVICDIDAGVGRALAEELGAAACFETLDVCREDAWEQVVGMTVERFGRLDILVNNAGVLHFGATADLRMTDAQRVLSVNVLGMLMGVKHATPALVASGRGVIVNISSTDGLRGGNGRIAYTASKWAVRGLTKALALELGPQGVRVVSIHPGGINTRMGNPAGTTGAALNQPYADVPLQRIGEPHEVAYATLFLCSDEASYITGAELAVDGGWTAGVYEAGLPGAPTSRRRAAPAAGPR